MDIFFTDPTDIPLPPAEVRIREFKAAPYPDGRRVRIYLEITPFQKRPSGEVLIQDAEGSPVATASIIETMDPKLELTLHLRNPETTGQYLARAILFYPAELPEDPPEGQPLLRPEPLVVDQVEQAFAIGE